jgi:hypothetical protein
VDLRSEASAGPLFLPLADFVPHRRRAPERPWNGHLAFLNDLITEHRPSLIVDVGSQLGDAYFGMCQSVAANGLNCVCYAVDESTSDSSTAEVSEYNQRFYSGFSYLLRCKSIEAQKQFSDESIDILQLHRSAWHHVHSWFQKVKPGGIVLLNDVMRRDEDCGVWKVWADLQSSHRETFTFHHSYGLGILRKEGAPPGQSGFLDLLFSGNGASGEQVRRHYILYDAYLQRLAGEAPRSGQVCVGLSALGERCQTSKAYAEVGVWSTLSFDLPPGSMPRSIGFYPADGPCLVEIAQMQICDQASGSVLCSLEGAADLKQLSPIQSAKQLPGSQDFLIFCYGDEPQLQWKLDLDFPGAVRVLITMRVKKDLAEVAELLDLPYDETRVASNDTTELEILRGELKAAQACKLLLTAKLAQCGTGTNAIVRERDEAIRDSSARLGELEALLEEANARAAKTEQAWAVARSYEMNIGAIEHSVSWQMTKPLREMLRLIRGFKRS